LCGQSATGLREPYNLTENLAEGKRKDARQCGSCGGSDGRNPMRLIVASNPLTEEAIKNKRIDRSLADMDALPPHSNAISSLEEEHPLRMFRTALLLLAILFALLVLAHFFVK
jgi:hypothetical protein